MNVWSYKGKQSSLVSLSVLKLVMRKVKQQTSVMLQNLCCDEAAPPPTVAPLNTQRPEHWKHFDASVNAVSFGFVATAILISMFLLLAIFERFLKQRSTESSAPTPMDLEGQMDFGGKLENPSPKMTIYGRGVLVLMPGEQVPTFIALPAPAPCSPEPISWPIQHNHAFLHL